MRGSTAAEAAELDEAGHRGPQVVAIGEGLEGREAGQRQGRDGGFRGGEPTGGKEDEAAGCQAEVTGLDHGEGG